MGVGRAITNQGIRIILLAVGAMLVSAGCSPENYRQEADREVAGILDDKWQADFGPQANYRMADMPSGPNDVVVTPVDPDTPLTLRDAVRRGIAVNRDYHARREALYLQVLDLTLARHDFSAQFFGLLNGGYDHARGTDSVSAGGSLGVNQLLADGAAISLGVATDWFRFLSGDPGTSLGSVLTAAIRQPLLRGAGREVVQERLTQAERDVLYELRRFARFRKTFVVGVISDYYRVLQSLDVVENARNDYERRQVSLERVAMLYQAGRLPRFEVDQAEQQVLQAYDGYVRAQESYQSQIDAFKIVLALPPDAALSLDRRELNVLAETGVSDPNYSVDDAVLTALDRRLDLAVTEDQVIDAERRIVVAANSLLPAVDVVGTANVPSQGQTDFLDLPLAKGAYGVGLDVDLGLDRLSERNAYRSAQIALLRRQRDFSLARDNVILEVRQAYRDLREAAAQYQIREKSLALAQLRVESTDLLLQAGQTTTRDVLESQADLLSAQNARTDALVRHTIAKLSFFRDIGLLQVRADGSWEHQMP